PDTRRPPGVRDVAAAGVGVAGVHVGLGAVAIDGELAGGGRFVETATQSRYAIDGEGVVEARARAALWVSPWVTVGGVLGTSMIARGEWTAGLFVGGHSWAFGGR